MFTTPAVSISLNEIAFGYSAKTQLGPLTLTVPAGKVMSILGQSGSGKSTLLKLLGGYLMPTSGRLTIGHDDATTLPPESRRAGMVFQNYALFPHLSADDNIAFGLRIARRSKVEIHARLTKMCDWIGLSADERRRYPHELSGGQQQRVALARALIVEPRILLLDEPFANLDRSLRERMRTELRRLQRQSGITTVLVTHDYEDALAMSDVIGLLDDGQLIQVGTPDEVYRKPISIGAAELLGPINVVPPPTSRQTAGADVRYLIRPEELTLELTDTAVPMNCWQGIVIDRTFCGSCFAISVKLDGGQSIVVHSAHDSAECGRTVWVRFTGEMLWSIPSDNTR